MLIARALYRRPSILLLDEATSFLDVPREKAVNASLRACRMTRVIVAHRPETIRSVDRVVLLERGKLVDAPQGALPLPDTVLARDLARRG